MKRIINTLAILIILNNLGFTQEVRTDYLYGLITDIRNAMPGNGSNGYAAPTTVQQDSFAIITNLILGEQYDVADSLAEYLDYSLYEWYDTGNNNHLYYVLMENGADNAGGVQLGWGTFIFDPSGYAEAIIEVPHPLWDSNTWKVGFKAYQNINAKYFLMAGAHRYANGSNPAPADVAHNIQNIFHTVHQKVSPYSMHSIQIHGFNKNNPNYTGYPDVVLSNGSSSPTQILDSLSNAIQSFGYSTGVFNGFNYVYLGATTNKQGQWSRSQGYSFIHMELEYFIRASESEWENIVDALNSVFLQPLLSLPEPEQQNPQEFALKQNYPNPFNSSTIIEYFIESPQFVQINIYDVSGQLINKLVDSKVEAGLQKVKWDSKNMNNQSVASGIYIYELKTENNRIHKKLILMN